jgi:phage recombination protein Bet
MTSAIQKAQPQSTLAPWLTEEQQKLIRDSYLNGCSKVEADVLIEVARSLELNPLLRQIHFVKRWDGNKSEWVWAFQVGIDGFRSIADRTGEYDGQDEPEYQEDAKGSLVLCKVRVYRKGISRPFVGVAYWSEYVQTKKDGTPNSMWNRGKHFMLAKCAEAAALRKAFPQKLSGVYTPEEQAAEDEVEINPLPEAATKTQTQRLKEAIKTKAAPKVVDVEPGETEEQAVKRAEHDFSGLAFDELAAKIDVLSAWLKKNPKDKAKAEEGQLKLAALQAELATRESQTYDAAPAEPGSEA